MKEFLERIRELITSLLGKPTIIKKEESPKAELPAQYTDRPEEATLIIWKNQERRKRWNEKLDEYRRFASEICTKRYEERKRDLQLTNSSFLTTDLKFAERIFENIEYQVELEYKMLTFLLTEGYLNLKRYGDALRRESRETFDLDTYRSACRVIRALHSEIQSAILAETGS